MSDMDLPRFSALCDAYGGTIARWPEPHRSAAAQLAVTVEGARLLARADRLDNALADWSVAGASDALMAAILHHAPLPRRQRRIALWWSGLAGLTLAGAAAGALAVTMLPSAPIMADDLGYADTAFGGWEVAG